MNVIASIRAAVIRWADRIVRRSRFDTRSAYATTQDSIKSALATLTTTGYSREIADINDKLTRDSHIRGVQAQLRAGVAGLEMEPVAVSDDPRAEQMAEAVKIAEERANQSALVNGIIAGYCRGVSLTEVLWEDPPTQPRDVASGRYLAGPLIPPKPLMPGEIHYWKGFAVVPQQRVRYDIATGEPLLILDPSRPNEGAPLSQMPVGKFIRCQVDEDIPDFALRGLYQSILEEWNDRRNARGWEMQAIERYGMPIPVGRAATQTGRDALKEQMADFGAAGMLIVDNQDAVEWGPNTTKELIYETFLEKSAERIAIAFLGATQTVNIAKDAGSKASAGEHQGIRRDILFALAELIAECKRRDLWIPFVRRNFGEAYVPFTPRAKAQFDEAIDLKTTAEAWAILSPMLAIPEGYARELTGIPAPAADEVTLSAPPKPVPALPPPLGFPRAAAERVKVPTPETPQEFGREITAQLSRIVKTNAPLAEMKRRVESAPEPDLAASADLLAAEMMEMHMKAMNETRNARGGAA